MTNEVSAGTKTMTIPLNTPERVSGKMIFTRTVRLFAPRSLAASMTSLLIRTMEL